MNQLTPIVGQWYMRSDTGLMFEVVSVDAHDGVEIQDYDGNLDEVDMNTWRAQDLEPIEQPEDLSGAFDVAEPDEADGSDESEFDRDWREPQPVRADTEEAWQSTSAEAESDEWGDGELQESLIADEPDAARRT